MINYYTKDDFIFIETYPKSGLYGNVFQVIEKKTNKRCVLKKYTNYSGFITDDIIKEITFLTFINYKLPDVAVILYGLIIDKKELFLVLEYLTHTLDDIIESYMLLPNRYILIENIIYQCISLIDKIHSLGIFHNDFKLDNIMVDSNNNLKIIDFGLTELLTLITNESSANFNVYYSWQNNIDQWKGYILNDKFIQSYRQTFTSDYYRLASKIVAKLYDLDLNLMTYVVYYDL